MDAPPRLPAQMFFLFARARQIEELRQPDLFSDVRGYPTTCSPGTGLFAELNLDGDELKLYDQIAENLAVDASCSRSCHLPAGFGRCINAAALRAAVFGTNDRFIERPYLEQAD